MARNNMSRCAGKEFNRAKAGRIESNRETKQTKHMLAHPNDKGEQRHVGARTANVECCICGKRMPFNKAVHTQHGIFCQEHSRSPHPGSSYSDKPFAGVFDGLSFPPMC